MFFYIKIGKGKKASGKKEKLKNKNTKAEVAVSIQIISLNVWFKPYKYSEIIQTVFLLCYIF